MSLDHQVRAAIVWFPRIFTPHGTVTSLRCHSKKAAPFNSNGATNPDYSPRFTRKAGPLLKPAQWASAFLAQSHYAF
jgi:hypothetical protein